MGNLVAADRAGWTHKTTLEQKMLVRGRVWETRTYLDDNPDNSPYRHGIPDVEDEKHPPCWDTGNVESISSWTRRLRVHRG